MNKKPQSRTAEFKFKVAVEALSEQITLVEIGSKYQLHPKQVRRWRDQLLLEGKELFIHKATRNKTDADPDKSELLHLVNQLSLELEFLKKKLKREA